MKILALDTASQSCGAALMADGRVICEICVVHGDTHSRYAMAVIDEILRLAGWEITEVEGFAVTTGPGSFTGLRIGLSTVKGLAMAAGRPVVGVSSLEALAYPFSVTGKLICPMLDARRREVYAAFYRHVDGRLTCVSGPFAESAANVLAAVEEPCVLTGDGALAYRDVITRMLGPFAVYADAHHIRASSLGHIAAKRFSAGQADDPARLEPLYLRASDAEKTLKIQD